MKKYAIAALAIVASTAIAFAQSIPSPAPVGGTGAYNVSPPVCVIGQWCAIQVDANGNLKTTGGGGGGGGAVTVANGADVAEGSTTDSPCAVPTSATACTVDGLLKALINLINANLLVSGTAGTPSASVLTTQHPTSNLVFGTTAAMTGTTTTQLIAAVASNRIYVTSISCVNSHATVGTFVTAQDGSGGTALATLAAASVYGGDNRANALPLIRTTVGNALFVADVTTGANVICSAAGFSGP